VRRIELELKVAPSHYEPGVPPIGDQNDERDREGEGEGEGEGDPEKHETTDPAIIGRAGVEAHEAVRSS
jgi:hypothetical protein